MDRKRYEEIMAKRRQHEERKKKLDLMSAVDESKFDTGNQNYNSYEAKFEAAKQHYQNSYVPKKAQEYYKGVENYRNSYSQVNKPSANNYTVMTPDNLSQTTLLTVCTSTAKHATRLKNVQMLCIITKTRNTQNSTQDLTKMQRQRIRIHGREKNTIAS